jgi:hypothetical protein
MSAIQNAQHAVANSVGWRGSNAAVVWDGFGFDFLVLLRCRGILIQLARVWLRHAAALLEIISRRGTSGSSRRGRGTAPYSFRPTTRHRAWISTRAQLTVS